MSRKLGYNLHQILAMSVSFLPVASHQSTQAAFLKIQTLPAWAINEGMKGMGPRPQQLIGLLVGLPTFPIFAATS